MSKLVQAISDAVQAGQNQDWAKLGTSIVGIVENGVGILGKLFDSKFPHITFIENINKHYKGDSNHGKNRKRSKSAIEAGQNQDWTKLGTSILDIVSNGVTELSKIFGF